MSEILISLVAFAVVSTISQGGATTLATASGVQFGLLRSVPLLAGISLGLGILIGVVAGGVGSLILARPDLQVWLRIAGSAYLLWLAWIIGRLGPPDHNARTARAHWLRGRLAVVVDEPERLDDGGCSRQLLCGALRRSGSTCVAPGMHLRRCSSALSDTVVRGRLVALAHAKDRKAVAGREHHSGSSARCLDHSNVALDDRSTSASGHSRRRP